MKANAFRKNIFDGTGKQLRAIFLTVGDCCPCRRSNRDLQSVIARSVACARYVGTVIALGRLATFSGLCHGVLGSRIQAQYNLIQVSWSDVVDKVEVSAETVLVTIL